jgi:hypothetical protein
MKEKNLDQKIVSFLKDYVGEIKRAKRAIEAMLSPSVCVWHKRRDHIQYVHDNAAVYGAKTRIAVVGLYSDGSKRISVEDDFFKLSSPAQRAILYHEYAHIELGHLDSVVGSNNKSRRKCAANGAVDQYEAEADMRAALQVGVVNYMNALHELSRVPYVNKKEIELRISLLQSL